MTARPKLNGSLIHAGREYHAGDEVPEGTDTHPVDMDRLKRLGLIGKPADADTK